MSTPEFTYLSELVWATIARHRLSAAQLADALVDVAPSGGYSSNLQITPQLNSRPIVAYQHEHGKYVFGGPSAPMTFLPFDRTPEGRGSVDHFRQLSVWKLSEMTKFHFPDGLFAADGRQIVKANVYGNDILVVDHVHKCAFPEGELRWVHPLQEPYGSFQRYGRSTTDRVLLKEFCVQGHQPTLRRIVKQDYEELRKLVMLMSLMHPFDGVRVSRAPVSMYEQAVRNKDVPAALDDLVAGIPLPYPSALATVRYQMCDSDGTLRSSFINEVLAYRHGGDYHHEKLYLYDPRTTNTAREVAFNPANKT